MKSLTTVQINRKKEIQASLESTEQTLHLAVSAFNAATEECWSTIQMALDAHAGNIDAANDFIAEVKEDQSCYAESHGDKWSESVTGQKFEEWKNSWEEDLQEVEVDEPEALEEPGTEGSDKFRELPVSA